MNTTENNLTLACFDDRVECVDRDNTISFIEDIATPGGGMRDFFESCELCYHSSWDWLMPVVEKIESLSCHIMISNKSCSIDFLELNKNGNVKKVIPIINGLTEYDSKIEAVYRACVEFIEWYNAQ